MTAVGRAAAPPPWAAPFGRELPEYPALALVRVAHTVARRGTACGRAGGVETELVGPLTAARAAVLGEVVCFAVRGATYL